MEIVGYHFKPLCYRFLLRTTNFLYPVPEYRENVIKFRMCGKFHVTRFDNWIYTIEFPFNFQLQWHFYPIHGNMSFYTCWNASAFVVVVERFEGFTILDFNQWQTITHTEKSVFVTKLQFCRIYWKILRSI